MPPSEQPSHKTTGLTPDIGIVELRNEVRFVEDVIQPICVPPSRGFKDRPQFGYVSGWGADNLGACDTNSNGPSPHTKCKFPFVYEREDGSKEIFSACAKHETPSIKNPICRQFFAWVEKNPGVHEIKYNMDESKSFKIYYWDEKRNGAAITTCYR